MFVLINIIVNLIYNAKMNLFHVTDIVIDWSNKLTNSYKLRINFYKIKIQELGIFHNEGEGIIL